MFQYGPEQRQKPVRHALQRDRRRQADRGSTRQHVLIPHALDPVPLRFANALTHRLLKVGNRFGPNPEAPAHNSVQRHRIGRSRQETQRHGPAAGRAVALHAHHSVGDRQHRLGLAIGRQQQRPEYVRTRIGAVQTGLLITRNGAVHILYGAGVPREHVGLELGHRDDRVRFQHGARHREHKAVRFHALRARLLEIDERHSLFPAQRHHAGLLPHTCQLSGIRRAVGYPRRGARGAHGADHATHNLGMRRDGFIRGVVR